MKVIVTRLREVELQCMRVNENAVVQNQGGDTVAQASVMWGDELRLPRPVRGSHECGMSRCAVVWASLRGAVSVG